MKRFDDSPAHSGSMGQEATEIWTTQTLLQPGRFLPPTLLAVQDPLGGVPGLCNDRQGDVMPHRMWVFVLFGFAWIACAGVAQASDSLRVGNRLLMVGDTAAHVQELLGRPSYRAHRGSSRGRHRRGTRGRSSSGGQRWQYRRDGHVIVVTIIDGLVTDIDERRS
jgi:hypothetical protein